MSLATIFKENRLSKVHFSEYLVMSDDKDEDVQPAQPEKPESE